MNADLDAWSTKALAKQRRGYDDSTRLWLELENLYETVRRDRRGALPRRRAQERADRQLPRATASSSPSGSRAPDDRVARGYQLLARRRRRERQVAVLRPDAAAARRKKPRIPTRLCRICGVLAGGAAAARGSGGRNSLDDELYTRASRRMDAQSADHWRRTQSAPLPELAPLPCAGGHCVGPRAGRPSEGRGARRERIRTRPPDGGEPPGLEDARRLGVHGVGRPPHQQNRRAALVVGAGTSRASRPAAAAGARRGGFDFPRRAAERRGARRWSRPSAPAGPTKARRRTTAVAFAAGTAAAARGPRSSRAPSPRSSGARARTSRPAACASCSPRCRDAARGADLSSPSAGQFGAVGRPNLEPDRRACGPSKPRGCAAPAAEHGHRVVDAVH